MSKKKKQKTKAKPKPKVKTDLVLLNFKATEGEHEIFASLADKYANGNLSRWVRHAARHYKPKRDEVIR